MTLIYAHTPTTPVKPNEYVEFINISQLANGNFRITVRQRAGHPTPQAHIDMSAVELHGLIYAVGNALLSLDGHQ